MIDLTEQLLASYAGRPRKIGRYNVSDLWAIVYGYLTPKEFMNGKEVDFEGAIRMWNGRWKHEQVQELLWDMGWKCEEKVEYQNGDIVVVGKVDAINETTILEIKTSSEVMQRSKSWHDYQGKCYCTMFERDKAIIVQPVINGRKVYLKEIGEVKRDDAWFIKQLDLIQYFHKSVLEYKPGEPGFKEIKRGKKILKV